MIVRWRAYGINCVTNEIVVEVFKYHTFLSPKAYVALMPIKSPFCFKIKQQSSYHFKAFCLRVS